MKKQVSLVQIKSYAEDNITPWIEGPIGHGSRGGTEIASTYKIS